MISEAALIQAQWRGVNERLARDRGDVVLKITIGADYFDKIADAFDKTFPGRVEQVYERKTWVQEQLARYIRRIVDGCGKEPP